MLYHPATHTHTHVGPQSTPPPPPSTYTVYSFKMNDKLWSKQFQQILRWSSLEIESNTDMNYPK